MRGRSVRAGVLIAVALGAGCATLPNAGPSSAELQERQAVEALQAQVAARADSLQDLRQGTAALHARIAELEAELQRITQLLTSGTARQGSAGSP